MIFIPTRITIQLPTAIPSVCKLAPTPTYSSIRACHRCTVHRLIQPRRLRLPVRQCHRGGQAQIPILQVLMLALAPVRELVLDLRLARVPEQHREGARARNRRRGRLGRNALTASSRKSLFALGTTARFCTGCAETERQSETTLVWPGYRIQVPSIRSTLIGLSTRTSWLRRQRAAQPSAANERSLSFTEGFK